VAGAKRWNGRAYQAIKKPGQAWDEAMYSNGYSIAKNRYTGLTCLNGQSGENLENQGVFAVVSLALMLRSEGT
jgi:hypothetical protein